MTAKQKSPLDDVRVGDRVWEGSQPLGTFFPKHQLSEVVAVTPTGFRVKGRPKDLFRKKNGKDWAGSNYRYYAIATPAECAEWDAQQERKRLENVTAQNQRDAAEAKRTELSDLFGTRESNFGIYVIDASFGDREFRKDKYDVTFHSLTESEVRALASLVK